jgi:hypothetical protein
LEQHRCWLNLAASVLDTVIQQLAHSPISRRIKRITRQNLTTTSTTAAAPNRNQRPIILLQP